MYVMTHYCTVADVRCNYTALVDMVAKETRSFWPPSTLHGFCFTALLFATVPDGIGVYGQRRLEELPTETTAQVSKM